MKNICLEVNNWWGKFHGDFCELNVLLCSPAVSGQTHYCGPHANTDFQRIRLQSLFCSRQCSSNTRRVGLTSWSTSNRMNRVCFSPDLWPLGGSNQKHCHTLKQGYNCVSKQWPVWIKWHSDHNSSYSHITQEAAVTCCGLAAVKRTCHYRRRARTGQGHRRAPCGARLTSRPRSSPHTHTRKHTHTHTV